ncbi:Uncharacterised protein [Shigella flexneri]|nr:Uncharacterised protein [Shigella flexneri]
MAGEQRHTCRTEDPHRVNAVMLVEAAVFRRDKGFHHLRWDLIQRNRNTTFLTVLSNQLAIGAVNLHRNLQANIF